MEDDVPQLLDIKNDFIFKQVFGREDNKDVLISLLNAILQDNPRITEIEELHNTDIPKIFEDNKGVRLDVLARIEDRTYINIEIQCRHETIIADRAIQYLSKTLVENTKANDPYTHPKVIGIWILAQNLYEERLAAINQGYMCLEPNDFDHKFLRISEKLRLVFVELNKFKPQDEQKRKSLGLWVEFLKNPAKFITSGETTPEITKAFDILANISADPEMRELYRLHQKAIHDQNSALILSRAEGKAEGLKEGEARGKAEKATEIALKLLSMHVPLEHIAKATGLSLEELKRLNS